MANLTIDYPEKRTIIEGCAESIIADYQRLAELLENMGFNVDDPAIILNAMFDSEALQNLKRKEFETFAKNIQMPAELREDSLRRMLAGIPEECKETFCAIRAEFRRDTEGMDIKPSDIRYHYRKFQLTEAKKSELLSSTKYTLTDEEQKDYNQISDIVKSLRQLRERNDVRAILEAFVSDRMQMDNERPMDDLPRFFREHRRRSRAEIEAERLAMEEKERRDAEEWERQRLAEREREAQEPCNVDSSFVRRMKAVIEHHKSTRNNLYGVPDCNRETTDAEADRIRNSIEAGHGEVIFVK